MTLLDAQTCIVRSAEPVSCEVEDGIVMLSIDRGSYFSLNATAAVVWRQLEAPTNVERIAAALAQEFDIEDDKCLTAVKDILKSFHDQRLIEIVHPE